MKKTTITLDLAAFEAALRTLERPAITADDLDYIREHYTDDDMANRGTGIMRGQRVALALRMAVSDADDGGANG